MTSVVMLAVSVAHYFLGLHFFYNQIFSFSNNEAENNTSTYSWNRDKFINEYDRANPVTSTRATRNYLKYLKSKTVLKVLERKTKNSGLAVGMGGFLTKISDLSSTMTPKSGNSGNFGGLAEYANAHGVSKFAS